jgi:hypothetical protein
MTPKSRSNGLVGTSVGTQKVALETVVEEIMDPRPHLSTTPFLHVPRERDLRPNMVPACS